MDKWLRNSNVVKVIALVLGVLLWVVVRLDNTTAPGNVSAMVPQKIYGVSITPNYDNEQYHIQSIEPNEVQITLRGKDSALRRVNPDTYKILLDLGGYAQGTHVLPLRPEGFPSGVDVEIYPPTAKVVLETKDRKEVPVEIVMAGQPAEGFKAGQPIIKPNRVLVTVPSSKINEIATVKGEVSIEQAKSAVIKQVKLAVYNKEGQVIEGSINPPVVDVEVPVTVPFKLMPLQVKLNGQPPNGFSVSSLETGLEQVTVYGPQNLLDEMDFYEGPTIDLAGMIKDETLQLDIPLRPGVTQVEPGEVEVEVNIVPSVTKLLEQVPITIVGSNSEFDTKIVRPETAVMDVKVEGASDIVNDLESADIQAIVDVSNLTVGQHELDVAFNLPQFVKKAPDPGQKVLVEITAKPANP